LLGRRRFLADSSSVVGRSVDAAGAAGHRFCQIRILDLAADRVGRRRSIPLGPFVDLLHPRGGCFITNTRIGAARG
jgi:hypothetical protein